MGLSQFGSRTNNPGRGWMPGIPRHIRDSRSAPPGSDRCLYRDCQRSPPLFSCQLSHRSPSIWWTRSRITPRLAPGVQAGQGFTAYSRKPAVVVIVAAGDLRPPSAIGVCLVCNLRGLGRGRGLHASPPPVSTALLLIHWISASTLTNFPMTSISLSVFDPPRGGTCPCCTRACQTNAWDRCGWRRSPFCTPHSGW